MKYLIVMKSFYQSYVMAFVKFAQRALDKKLFIFKLSQYAMMINEKANELIKRATLNTRIDLARLRKEIYQLGIVYIHKFSNKVKYRDKPDREE